MKSFILSLIIAGLIVAGSIMYTKHIDKVSSNMIEINRKIISYVIDEKYKEAYSEVNNLQKYVEEKKIVLAATINHENIDEIEISMSQLKRYIEGGEKSDSLASCEALDVILGHLPKNYKLKIENIL